MPTTDVAAAPFSEPPATSQFRARLSQACGGDGQRMFVLLDGARIQKLWAVLRELRSEHLCLFRESPKESLAHVAPYIARLQPDSDLALYLTFQDGALDTALFFTADANLEDLHRHFRRFLNIRDSEGKEVYFRFYDARVLGPFLKICTPEEKAAFFGSIREFLIFDPEETEAKKTVTLKKIGSNDGRIVVERFPDAKRKFQLRPEHDAEFSRDVLERYMRRCVEYLRERHPERLAKADDEKIHVLIRRAQEVGKPLGLTSGLDVTRLSEVVLIGFTEELRARLRSIEPRKRSDALRVLRDELTAGTLTTHG
jgi:hypothetical protein